MTRRSSRPHDVEFVGAVAAPGEPPPTSLPQVAIAGKSNVGKSTLINRLVNRKKLARTSKRPGKTQEINFFEIDGRFALVDLPGYGFARAPPDVRQRWGPLIESYLGRRGPLLGLVLLIDARHGPSPDDRQMVDYLERLRLPTLFVLTKVDKLPRSERSKRVRTVRDRLGVDEDQILATSGRTGAGVRDLWESIVALVEGSGA